MKILVFDDNKNNRAAARVQLKDHDLKVVGNYEDAEALLFNDVFDVVMTDLLVPAPAREQAYDSPYVGQEMPIGIFIALLAAVRGVRFIAVVSCNHHKHPGSACMDPLKVPFNVEGAKMFLTNRWNIYQLFDPADFSKPLEMDGLEERTGPVRAKNWEIVLGWLTR